MKIKTSSDKSLAGFIKGECCQHTGGVCLGVAFTKKAGQEGFGGEKCARDANGLCGVLTQGNRCAFFERSVLPIAQERGLRVVTLHYPPDPARPTGDSDGERARRSTRDHTDSQGGL